MLQSFSHAANLQHWLGRPDCPLAIQECKRLFDTWYGMSTSDKEPQSLSGDGIFIQSVDTTPAASSCASEGPQKHMMVFRSKCVYFEHKHIKNHQYQ
jgi:hypothetical protein